MKRTLLSLLSVLAWVGCSSSQPGPGAEESTLKNESAFCGEWAKAVCNEDVVAACNGTRSGCLTTQKAACSVLVPAGYKSTHAEDCLEAARDAYADAELTAEELDVVLKLGGDCARLTNGGQDEGGDCVSSVDCDGVNGFECVVRPGQPLGTCQVSVEVGGGDSCLDPEIVCEDGFYCDGENCLRRKVSAAACANDDMCAADLRCEIATGETEGTCIARLDNGDPCMADDECVSGVCLGSTETDKICLSSIILTVRDPLCRGLR